MSGWRLSAIVLGVACAALSVSPAAAQTAGQGVVVLDSSGVWKMYHVLSAPVMQDEGGLKAIPYWDPNARRGQVGELAFWHGKLLAAQTAATPADWTKPDFDDSGWVRGSAYRACRTPYLERLCLRGKFVVTDPAKVQTLKLDVGYHGGAVVYVNGQELQRQDVDKGGALAAAYPLEAFVDEAGKLISLRGDEPLWKTKPSAETAKRIASRERKFSVEVPAKSLRKGTNVICVEILRAPYHKVLSEQLATSDNHGKHLVWDISWNTCEVKRVRLTTSSADGLTPSATRPQGFQVWTSDPLSTDFDLDFGGVAEPPAPIRLVGAANGFYSGKVTVGSSAALQGLSAKVEDLKGTAGAIPASAIRIRYGMPWGDIALTTADSGQLIPYAAEPSPLLAMYDSAPAVVPVYKKDATKRCLALPGQPEQVFGAVASVWVTVRVPADAKPGTYSGRLTISAQGMEAVSVPVNVEVADWKLPDPAQWKTWVELIEAPDTTVIEYKLAPWSQKHLQMIGKSMTYLAEVGSKVLFVPLIAHSNAGNEESMVRWVKKGENPNGAGQYDYDFSVMEKYLDLAEKSIGKPEVVIFNAWDRYLIRKDSSGRVFQVESGLKSSMKGPMVTVVDAAGKAENVVLPDFTEPPAKAMWKPLFDQLRERMKKRGIEKAMQLGMCSDFWASKENVEFLKEVSGDLPWANAGHYVRPSLYDGLAKFGYQSSYFGTAFGYGKTLSGWNIPQLYALFERVPIDNYPVTKWRLIGEQSITGNVRGVGRLGADTWRAVKDKNEKRIARVWEKYPGSNWGYLNCDSSALAPSPEGPVATTRFEALREGVQECEAIIVLEKALMDKAAAAKLGPELAKKCQDTLDERRSCLWRSYGLYQSGADYSYEVTSWRERTGIVGSTWMLGSGWQERSEKLYNLVGEVERKLGNAR